ncbi:MAG: 50S ribosomal protein L19 [Lentisphaerae bacterium]|nr:50S ribosomal protein L19 [Lentisphaerota bacterium]
MIHPLMQAVEESAKREPLADFHIGDTVTVYVRIIEGDKRRVQTYTGVVIGRRGKGMGETFTVRRIVNNEGVERIFPVNSPKIAKVEVVRSGHVRRAKLYYLRDRVGKATRVKDKRRPTGKQAKQAEDKKSASAEPVAAGA